MVIKRYMKVSLASLVAIATLASALPAPASAGWTNFSLQPAVRANWEWGRACKTPQTGGYGPVWAYTFQMRKRDPYYPGSMGAGVLRDDAYWLQPYPGVVQTEFIYGVIGGLTVYGSQLHDDRIQFLASSPGSGPVLLVGARGVYASWQIANC
jgi:hypothetical protein